MVGALVRTGVINRLAQVGRPRDRRQCMVTTMLILAVSFLVSGIVNNVPYAATMTPIVAELVPIPAAVTSIASVLWWALPLGTDLGGNLTAVGASANVIVVGVARRADNPISFWEFTRKGAVVTAISFALSAAYLWLRYFVLA